MNECKCTIRHSNLVFRDSYVKNHTDIVLFLLSSGEIIHQPSDATCSQELQDLLFYPSFKAFVVGHASSGKSTLIKALQSHFQGGNNRFSKWVKRFSDTKVIGVEPHTAGIIPVPIRTPHGCIIMYDFAGQNEYYSSHAAICENVMDDKSL